MICQNPKCIAGFVRKFKAATDTEKASFYDEVCPFCKGDYMDEKLEMPEPVKEQPDKFEDAELEDDLPF